MSDWASRAVLIAEEGAIDTDEAEDFALVIIERGARTPVIAFGGSLLIAEAGSVVSSPSWMRIIEVAAGSPYPIVASMEVQKVAA